MPVLRILIGVIVGGAILAGLLAAAVRFPSVGLFGMFGVTGSLFFLVVINGLRTGVIGARRSRYERASSPVAFWFYIIFYSFIGAVVFGYGVYSLIHGLFAGKPS